MCLRGLWGHVTHHLPLHSDFPTLHTKGSLICARSRPPALGFLLECCVGMRHKIFSRRTTRHFRVFSSDILFGLFKEILPKRKDLRLVVMSATLETQKFQDYFDSAPLMNIPGRLFPVEMYYTPEAERDYVEASIRTAMQIHCFEPPGDILVFLTGEEEIEHAVWRINSEGKQAVAQVFSRWMCVCGGGVAQGKPSHIPNPHFLVVGDLLLYNINTDTPHKIKKRPPAQ